VVSTAPQGAARCRTDRTKTGVPDVATDPEELDPELDVELGGDDPDEDLDEDLDGIPDGFVVDGEDVDDDADADDVVDDAEDAATAKAAPVEVEDPDDFEEDIAPVVRVPEEEDEAPARRTGEFVCTRCFLVKRDSQMAVKSRKVCRDCA
jgi:hypothetical protein